jgi:MFS family permease
MRPRQLALLILGSVLITLDGGATNVALPAIGRDLSISVSGLQWITNAPLLVLAVMLLPAGTLADRYGRIRMMRIGLTTFAAGAIASAAAPSETSLIAARLVQGAGGAFVLPASLAVLRGSYRDEAERTRVFGVWAAWTGVASAAGPLLAGGLIDFWTWRAVFLPPAVAGGLAAVALAAETPAAAASRRQPVPIVAMAALMALLSGSALLLIRLPVEGMMGWRAAVPAAIAVLGAVLLTVDPKRHILIPRELVTARNCLPAHAATFALYFGVFGLSFLLVLYLQQVLDYSALWAAVVLLPMSIMLFLAERFGRLTAAFGTRALIVAGALAAAAGIVWMGNSPHPLPFWSRIVAGTAIFGFGISLTVSALTNAAVSAVPESCAGAASALNHATVRAAGLFAVALLGSIAAPGFSDVVSADGVQRAMLICAAVVATGGIGSSVLLRNDAPGGLSPSDEPADPAGRPPEAANDRSRSDGRAA